MVYALPNFQAAALAIRSPLIRRTVNKPSIWPILINTERPCGFASFEK